MEKFCIDGIEFYVLNIIVDEKVNKKNIKNFIFTYLRVSNLTNYKKYNIFYSFVKEIKTYQIIIYLDDLPFFNLLQSINKEFEVFIYKFYIFVYKNSKFYYFYSINYSLSIDEINHLISNKLKLNINSIKNIKTIKNSNKQIIYDNIIKPFAFFNLTILFSITIISIFTLYLFSNENRIEKPKVIHKNIKQISNYKYKVVDLINILKLINNYNLNLDEISYENNQYCIYLSAKNINKIHNFLDSKVYQVDVKSLIYNKQRQKNELICTIDKI
ncbi:hypothetical protein CRV00_05835 [Malaciobacter molluscorum]|uniref:hypothetical protein n=1 Tax=Malaciobacter molluscorum TaxID=1032072 RepID=UPI00100BD9C1|nr:hypothetical protein [Malaciobacter molluscorum]RXJ94852.1 hypothetical protein CRV00_05835 [Malaciobacter molluscorum]